MSLFDYAEGEALKKKGMKKVLDNEDQNWREEFEQRAVCILNYNGSVTAEEVIADIGNPPHHRNSIGAMMRSFAKVRGLVRTFVKSQHPAAHSRLVAKWSRP